MKSNSKLLKILVAAFLASMLLLAAWKLKATSHCSHEKLAPEAVQTMLVVDKILELGGAGKFADMEVLSKAQPRHAIHALNILAHQSSAEADIMFLRLHKIALVDDGYIFVFDEICAALVRNKKYELAPALEFWSTSPNWQIRNAATEALQSLNSND